MLTKALVVGAVLLGSVAVLPSAQAEDPKADHRPCVTRREMAGKVYKYAPISRDALERRWEVRGLGIDLTASTPNIGGHHSYLYPACGYTFDQVQVIIVTERTNRPGYDRTKTLGQQTVVGGAWWTLPPGYVCGPICEQPAGA